MTGRCKASLWIWLAAVLATGIASPCLAVDYQPFDWVPLPPGTYVAMGFYEYGARTFNGTIAGTANNNANLDSHIGIARYLHYSEISEHPYVLDFILPFGALTDGEIDGKCVGDASGVGDPMASVGYWFINPARAEALSVGSYLPDPAGRDL